MQVRAPIPTLPRCGACGLHKGCKSPKMPASGDGARKILILGEAPGADEDDQGKPFVGKTGRKLRETLHKFGVNPDRDCWFYNAIICRPPNNETPDEKKIDHCRPNVINTIKQLNPEIVIPLGSVAVRSLLEWLWKEGVGGIGRWLGWQVPCQRPNMWVCPAWHPSYVLRMEDDQVVQRIWNEHIEKAVELEGRPWQIVPDFRKTVEVIMDPKEAAKKLRIMACFNQPLSFDYECNMLKPDHPDARIVCVAFSSEKTTIAFPWMGEAIEAVKQVLQSNCPKWGWNIKMEDRWTWRKLGIRVKNFQYCGMTGTHVLDNRSGITSLKFQSFVRVGQDVYNTHIESMLEADGGNLENQIKRISLKDLLIYCGMDALLEHYICGLQRKELGL